jgi:hypothetical protein
MVAEEPVRDGQEVLALQFGDWTRGLQLFIVKLSLLRIVTQILSLKAVVNTVIKTFGFHNRQKSS